ncbi:MAG: hypothetical protein FJ096_10535 [Deltaproteobacteria bacterium]|nr:hypothetical protein [Deltaproteobacteria bacterium]
MSRHTPVFVLLACQALVVGVAAVFHLKIRFDLLAMELPLLARERLATASTVVPWSVGLGTLVVLSGVALRRGRSRLRIVASGLVVSALPAVLTTLAIFEAVFAR